MMNQLHTIQSNTACDNIKILLHNVKNNDNDDDDDNNNIKT